MSVPQPGIRVVATVIVLILVGGRSFGNDGLVLPPAMSSTRSEIQCVPDDVFVHASNSRIFASSPVRASDAPVVPVPGTDGQSSVSAPVVAVDKSLPPVSGYIYEPFCQARTIYAQQVNTPRNWFRAEALLWWTSHVDVPVIATTSPLSTPGLQAGVLGQSTTGVVFGGDDLYDFAQGGFRVRGGHWFDRNDGSGWHAEFFMLGSRGHDFIANSNGDPVIARPFTNALTGAQDAQLLAFPGVSRGAFSFNSETRLYSFGFSYWAELVEDNGECNCNSCGERSQGACYQRNGDQPCDTLLGLKLGPRFYHLDDTLLADESLTGTASGNQFRILDSFKTENSFLGGEIGLHTRKQRQSLSLDLGLNLAIGTARQELDVRGQTGVTSGGANTVTDGGFYAQSTNSGSWHRNRLSVVPSMECALGFEARDGWRFSVAYNLMYWTNVLRAAEQIDSTINPNLFPPSVASVASVTEPARPAAQFNESDYLAHGISIAIEKRW